MQITSESTDSEVIVKVEGDITAQSCHELRESLIKAGETKPQTLRLDLSKVLFIDSSGLGVLVGVRGQLKKYGTQLIIYQPQPAVIRLFQLTKLDRVFGIQA